jgi:hypothetical protein
MNYLCEHYDLIFLQEHWLREEELYCLNSIHPEFTGFGVSAIDISSGFLSGRPYGGVCILWRKLITNYISIERYDDKLLVVHLVRIMIQSCLLRFICPTRAMITMTNMYIIWGN